MDLINQASYGLMSEGRIDYRAMEFVWDLNNIPHKERRYLFDKFLVYIRLQLEHMKNELKKMSGNTGHQGMRT